MIIHALAPDYRQIASKRGLPELRKEYLKVTSCSLSEKQADDLKIEIEEFKACQGWLRYQSGLAWFSEPPATVAVDGEDGRLLHGELTTKDRRDSLHVRLDGRGGWRLFRFTAAADGTSGGEPCLVQDLCLLAEPPELRSLDYAVYWGLTDEGVARRMAARFTGFSLRGEPT